MTEKEKISVIYHRIFNYELSPQELKHWVAGPKLLFTASAAKKTSEKKRVRQTKLVEINEKKMEVAKRASVLLGKIPTVLFVGVTGSLAMNNAQKESDIDLMVITKESSIWITRPLSLLLLNLSGFKTRRAGVFEEEDKICLNLWLDSSSLLWSKPKNAYIAHEIAQVIPLINKEKTYESWISQNKWVRAYWPHIIPQKFYSKVTTVRKSHFAFFYKWLNFLCYMPQVLYMRSKRTREQVSLHEAFFHPYDWGAKVVKKLQIEGISEIL